MENDGHDQSYGLIGKPSTNWAIVPGYVRLVEVVDEKGMGHWGHIHTHPTQLPATA